MKIKKEYIRPIMEVLDPELMENVLTTISMPKGSGTGDTEISPEDELSRKNDFTFTDDDW